MNNRLNASAKRGSETINRAEAISVLTELLPLHSEIAFSNIVEIRKLSDSEFELRIKCALDDHGRKSIRTFLEKRNLKMREEEGFTVIYQ